MDECQHHNNCGGYCETPAEIDANLCADCMAPDQEREIADTAMLAVRAAVRGYYAAFDRKDPGGGEQDAAFRAIERALGMRWIQGASIRDKTPNV